MQNKELLEKIIAEQDKIIKAINADQSVDIPEKLRHAEEAAEAWARGIEGDDGRDKEEHRWPVKQFAQELHEHIALFDHETRQRIQEYCELVKRMPYDMDETLGC